MLCSMHQIQGVRLDDDDMVLQYVTCMTLYVRDIWCVAFVWVACLLHFQLVLYRIQPTLLTSKTETV